MFRSIATVILPEVGGQAADPRESAANHVFKVLHGFYGNLFFSKYASGKVNKAGEDEGLLSVRAIWDYGLREYSADTVKAALRQCQEAHPEFPPSMPQFVALCAAIKPRGKPADATKLLGMAPALRSQYAKTSREIIARHTAKAAQRETGYVELQPTLAGLKQAIASAVAAAGGDEVAELLRLDRLYPEKV